MKIKPHCDHRAVFLLYIIHSPDKNIFIQLAFSAISEMSFAFLFSFHADNACPWQILLAVRNKLSLGIYNSDRKKQQGNIQNLFLVTICYFFLIENNEISENLQKKRNVTADVHTGLALDHYMPFNTL